MVKIEFLGPIGLEPIEMEANTLQEVAALLQKNRDIKLWLENCAVAVNDEIVRDINRSLQNGDKISLLPPVCGG